jgi:hypothetical protein
MTFVEQRQADTMPVSARLLSGIHLTIRMTGHMKELILTAVGILAVFFIQAVSCQGADSAPGTVDFRYSPPEWQTAICLPDDPHKSLVDRSGELLYHYGQGGREFATRISIEVVSNAVWQKQEVLSPRVPIVRTFRTAEGLEIVEEAFAVTDLRQPTTPPPTSPLQRLDSGGTNRDWAKPPAGTDPSLRHIAVHMGGNLRYELAVAAGSSRRVALALCEGWWKEAGKRVQVLRVEGTEPKAVDTVADIGQNKAAAFWFDGKDANADGKIEIAVDAAPQAADKNTILNGLWVFAADHWRCPGLPRPRESVLGKGAAALWPGAGAGRGNSGVDGFLHSQHLASA